MLRRLFLLSPLAPTGIWGWRWHMVARHECARGPTLMLIMRGEVWKLTQTERELIDAIAAKFRALEPQVMQEKLPKA
jgi:hypothetical protein